jgi:outer membrane autotransporter protein
MWQGQSALGHTDSFGGYLAYGSANVDVRGLVTNADATNYVVQRTGSLSLHATSVGAYWTHYGPSGWYLDGVAQATTYRGSAATSVTRLNLPGTGFIASLEFGYPIALPGLGESFVLEPQVQAIRQYVNFGPRNDGLGLVTIGSAHGSTGRVGLRGKWQLGGHNGQVWMPYIGLDLRRDWGARSTTVFGIRGGDASALPMVPQATRASLAGGLTAQWSPRWSFYGATGYEHELGSSNDARRRGFDAHVGARYVW